MTKIDMVEIMKLLGNHHFLPGEYPQKGPLSNEIANRYCHEPASFQASKLPVKPLGIAFTKFNLDFSNYFSYNLVDAGKIPTDFNKFEAKPDYLYHGTNTEALDSILQDGTMYPPIILLRKKKFVYGELFNDMKRDGDFSPNGPKFMLREALVKAGILTPDNPDFYKFGHAGDICFGNVGNALNYIPHDCTKAVIIGIDRKVAEFHGATFFNGKNEGTLHEGSLNIYMLLKQLLVPDHLVEHYKEKTAASYLVKVFSISEFLPKVD